MVNIGIVGGDLRIINLIKLLDKDNYKIYTYGLEKNIFTNENIIVSSDLEQLAKITDTIITSIPISKDKRNVNTPFSKKVITIEELFNILRNKTIISGALNENIFNLAKDNNIKIIDILQNENLAILNAIPTAEGAIQIAMQESNITLHDSNILILGFGRIGKILSKMLYGIGAKVFCEARKDVDIAKIKSYGYNEIELKDLDKNLQNYDFIFNTIPDLILDKTRLQKVKKECIIIDLASAPGGVDFEEAKKLNIKALLELGLPGKIAPKTAAKYIKDVLEKIIKKE